MLLLLMLGMQADPADAVVPDSLRASRPCPKDDGSGDVTVCGRIDPNRYRLTAPPPPVRPAGPWLAETHVGKAMIGLHAEKGSVGTTPTNRATATVRLPF